jgi:hypothetical protein
VIQRGRKSALAKPVVIEGGFASRPEPPDTLTERQAEIWRLVTASEDQNVFATAATRDLLADYCRRREAAEKITEIANLFQPEWLKSGDGVKRYTQLLKIRDMEVRGATSLATKLRLTNQSRYQTSTATVQASKAIARVAKPWEL